MVAITALGYDIIAQQARRLLVVMMDWNIQSRAHACEACGKTFADKEDFQFLDEGIGNDPRAIRLFAKIASKMGEDGILGTPKGLTLSPEEAKLEISKINNDKEHPYWKADHIEHAAAVKRMSTLQELAQGT